MNTPSYSGRPKRPFRRFILVLIQSVSPGPLTLALVCFAAVSTMTAATGRREIQRDDKRGHAGAVVVAEAPLVHTASFVARDKTGAVVGRGDIARQTEEILTSIDRALQLGQSSLDQIVKLNLSVSEAKLLEPVRTLLARRFASRAAPAVTLVVSEQELTDAMISGDAIGLGHKTSGTAKAEVSWLRSDALFGSTGQTHTAILPAGPRIYFSGKTGKGKTAEAVADIMKQMSVAMEFLQTKPTEVVQVTVMLHKMKETAEAAEALRPLFGEWCPPVTFIERNAGEGAMEIELLAVGKAADSKRSPQVEYLTPAGGRTSPMYTQIVRVNRGGAIYTSGVSSTASADPGAQAAAVFATLDELIRAAGGDFDHLAKAIYHITGREAAMGMDKVRPKVYAGGRPPAASRNTLRQIGPPGAVMMVDLIGAVIEK